MTNRGEPLDSFEAITAGLTLDVSVADLPVLRSGARMVRIDPLTGETFRVQMRDVVLGELGRLGLPREPYQPLDSKRGDKVVTALNALLLSPRSTVRMGGEVAVTGPGLFGTEQHATVGETDVIVLDDTQAMCGTVIGAGYGEFPLVAGSADLDGAADEESGYTGPLVHGPVLCLGSVAVSGINPGEWQTESFAMAFVPLAEPDLRLHAVHPF
jgi:hypothetical protein